MTKVYTSTFALLLNSNFLLFVTLFVVSCGGCFGCMGYRRSNSLLVCVGLCHGHHLSQILLVTFMDRTSSRSPELEGFQLGWLRIESLLWDLVGYIQHTQGWFTARMRIRTSKSEATVLSPQGLFSTSWGRTLTRGLGQHL